MATDGTTTNNPPTYSTSPLQNVNWGATVLAATAGVLTLIVAWRLISSGHLALGLGLVVAGGLVWMEI